LQAILISAMIQSQQAWLPVLHQPIDFSLLFRQEEVVKNEGKFIAHCIDTEKHAINATASSSIILIGPEGDFTPAEVQLAIENNFTPVTLGNTRLRTETAALVATTLLVMS
jgi:16S rRNA (uracil1498-N3)-methyltransferase